MREADPCPASVAPPSCPGSLVLVSAQHQGACARLHCPRPARTLGGAAVAHTLGKRCPNGPVHWHRPGPSQPHRPCLTKCCRPMALQQLGPGVWTHSLGLGAVKCPGQFLAMSCLQPAPAVSGHCPTGPEWVRRGPWCSIRHHHGGWESFICNRLLFVFCLF